MKTIDFNLIFESLSENIAGNQRKIVVDSVLSVYLGISIDGYIRLSFMSTIPFAKLDSTQVLRVSQGNETEGVFWTCFDLLDMKVKSVFFTFCTDLINSIQNIYNEHEAFKSLRKRYMTWKQLFKRNSKTTIPMELLQGIYGELFFLYNYLIKHFGINKAVSSWSGPDMMSKDYAIVNTWFEIKTVGANKPYVHISSLTQLSSNVDGHLIIIRAEKMANDYNVEQSSVGELFKLILEQIEDESIEFLFASKISSYGYDITDEMFNTKFSVKSMTMYLIGEDFPKLIEADIARSEIVEVEYSLIINSLSAYKEQELL
ncbi:MAG: PD-(D/E)XK motif protein [Anaerovoracaceae bacterium]